MAETQPVSKLVVPALPNSRRRLVTPDELDRTQFPAELTTVVCKPERTIPLDPFEFFVDGALKDPKYQAAARGRNISLPASQVTYARDISICGYGLMMTSDGYLLPESNIRLHHAFPEGADHYRMEGVPRPAAVRRVEEPTIILTRVWPLHFSHWMYDNLATLTFVRKLGDLGPSTRIAIGHGNRDRDLFKRKSAQAESLQLLGVDLERVMRLDEQEWVHFDQAIIPWPVNEFRPPFNQIFNQPEIFDLFQDMRKAAAPNDAPATKKVFFSRLDTPVRKLTNESQIIERLSPLGFEATTMGGLSLEDQIRLYSEIDVAVGPLGNSLMGLCFMRPGSTLIVLTPEPLVYCLAYYQSFCTSLGIHLVAIVSSHFGPNPEGVKGMNNSPWTLDSELTYNVVRKVMADRQAP